MTRLMMMTFFGEKRWQEDVHPHESPKVMTWPLIALGALSRFGGALAIGGWITDWLAPVVGAGARAPPAASRPGSSALAVLAGRRGRRRCWACGCYAAASRSPGETPADSSTSRSSPAPAATSCTATRSTTRSRCGPRVTSSAPGLPRRRGHRRLRHRSGGPARRRGQRPAQAADRVRAQLRAQHRGGRPRRARDSPGGDARMILTSLMAHAAGRRARRSASCRARTNGSPRSSPPRSAWSRSPVSLAMLARLRRRRGRLPAHREAHLDQAVRRVLLPRRQRHRRSR